MMSVSFLIALCTVAKRRAREEEEARRFRKEVKFMEEKRLRKMKEEAGICDYVLFCIFVWGITLQK